MNNQKQYDPFSGGSSKVTLDFAALPLWWLNGNGKLPPGMGVPHFGGWACHDSDMAETLNNADLQSPMGFTSTELRNTNGESYTAWLARSVAIVPTLRRSAWFTKRETGKQYSVVNILAYMAEIDKTKKSFVPWGFCVLSGKAFSGVAIDDALASWRKTLQPMLRKIDQSVPLSHLWVTLGTFGTEIVTESKGKKGGQQSPITPCKAGLPKEISPEWIKGHLVSDEILAVCAEAREASMEWAQAWNERTDETQPQTGGNEQPTEPEMGEADNNSEIPF